MQTKHFPLCIKCKCIEVHPYDHPKGIKYCRACISIQQRSPSMLALWMAKSLNPANEKRR